MLHMFDKTVDSFEFRCGIASYSWWNCWLLPWVQTIFWGYTYNKAEFYTIRMGGVLNGSGVVGAQSELAFGKKEKLLIMNLYMCHHFKSPCIC